jgi:hypothetical protein
MSETTTNDEPYTGWAIVKLMGHRQTAGRVAQVQMYGATMLRVDTPEPGGGTIASQMYGGTAIYCVTPCTEAVAMRALQEAYNLPPMVALALREREPKAPPPQIEDGRVTAARAEDAPCEMCGSLDAGPCKDPNCPSLPF